jgi:hypothetical protein
MNTKALSIVLAALVCTAVALVEEQRIGGLRAAVAQGNIEANALRDELSKSAAESKALKERNEALLAESEQLRTRIASLKTETPAAGATASNGADNAAKGASADKGSDSKGGFMKGIAKMFSDPEMRKMMRGQQSMGVKMMYGDLAKELGLSTEQANEVMELLTDRQLDASAKAMAGMEGDADPGKLVANAEEAQKAVNDYDTKLKGVLGDDKMKKLNEYERTLGDRMAMQQYQQSFTASGVPLDEAQRTGLLQIMKEERLKGPANPLEPGNKDVAASMKALQSGEGFDQAIQSQRDLNQRVLARAHTVLTPDQMTAFETAQKAQMQMQEMGMKMGKAMFGGGDKGK